MKKNSILSLAVILLASLVLIRCIDPFDLDVYEESDLLVIHGSIVKGNQTQVVEVSRTSPIAEQEKNIVTGCQVVVENDRGTEYTFTGDKRGKYYADIPDAELVYGRQFRLRVKTPDGQTYLSGYEEIPANAPLDSIYFETIEKYLPNVNAYRSGLQFYVDLKAPQGNSKYFRWTIDETWEYHAEYPFNRVWDGVGFTMYETTYDSFKVCWKNGLVDGLFSASTANLERNEKKKINLHYIENDDWKLAVKYSYLVSQYALSEGAYEFWNQRRVELGDNGGLYTTQPSQTISNIKNTTNDKETVLGYFWAAERTEKRAFANKPFGYTVYCTIDTIQTTDLTTELADLPKPVYLYQVEMGPLLYDDKAACLDCRVKRGTTQRPSFWE